MSGLFYMNLHSVLVGTISQGRYRQLVGFIRFRFRQFLLYFNQGMKLQHHSFVSFRYAEEV